MKLKSWLLSAASVLALSACDAPRYTSETLASDAAALSQVAPEAARERSKAAKLTGNFKTDIAQAVQKAPEYVSALSAVTEAQHLVSVSRAARKPQIQTTANLGTLSESGAGLPSNSVSGASGTLSLQQLMYDGGESAAAIDGAQAAAFIAEIEADIVANRLALQAGSTWIDLQAITAQQSALNTLMTKADQMLNQVETLVTSGMIDQSASTSAVIAVRRLELERSQLEAREMAAVSSYLKHFGARPKQINAPADIFGASDLAKIKSDWTSSPLLLQSAAQVLSAKQALLAAEGRKKPKIGLKAGLNAPKDRDEQASVALGFEVSWILGDGGRREADIAAKASRLEAAEQALEGVKLAGQEELDTAISQRNTLVKNLRTLDDQKQSAAKEIEILWSQLATGQTTVRQLIDAEVNGYRMSDARITAQAELAKLELEMLARTGLLAKKLVIRDPSAPTEATK